VPDAQAAVKQHFGPPEGHIGIVCSRDGSVARTLTQDEAIDSITVTILDGLVRTGIGYNFSSRKNSEYWFVGFGLFNLLGQIKDLGQ